MRWIVHDCRDFSQRMIVKVCHRKTHKGIGPKLTFRRISYIFRRNSQYLPLHMLGSSTVRTTIYTHEKTTLVRADLFYCDCVTVRAKIKLRTGFEPFRSVRYDIHNKSTVHAMRAENPSNLQVVRHDRTLHQTFSIVFNRPQPIVLISIINFHSSVNPVQRSCCFDQST